MAKTIFILGAGASYPYGFPLGTDLVNYIVEQSQYQVDHLGRYNATPNYLGGLLISEFSASIIDSFRKYLRESGTNSIDSFISENKQFMQIGKACIAYILLECEKKYGHIPVRGGDWYKHFANILVTEDPNNFDFKIYTFNYERSLEHYLKIKAESFFVNNAEKQERFIKNIPIIHLHGSLGGIGFGKVDRILDYFKLESIANNIKIISEVEPDENFERLQKDIKLAENVIFIGFGFHPQNMNRIGLSTLRLQGHYPIFYASTLGFEDTEVKTQFLGILEELIQSNKIYGNLETIGKWLNVESYMFLRKMIDTRNYFK